MNQFNIISMNNAKVNVDKVIYIGGEEQTPIKSVSHYLAIVNQYQLIPNDPDTVVKVALTFQYPNGRLLDVSFLVKTELDGSVSILYPAADELVHEDEQYSYSMLYAEKYEGITFANPIEHDEDFNRLGYLWSPVGRQIRFIFDVID